MASDDKREKWYYDACALDSGLETYSEIINKNHPIKPIVSHLSLGEAYGNCHGRIKSKEASEAFIDLINRLKALNKLNIVGNDGINDIFDEIRNDIPHLSITDLMHLATAIKNKCNIFRTIDDDFINLSDINKKKIKEIAEKSYTPNFVIRRVGRKK